MPKKRKEMLGAKKLQIAKAVCLKYLDAGGFNSAEETEFVDDEIDSNGNVTFTIRVMITSLDIEQ